MLMLTVASTRMSCRQFPMSNVPVSMLLPAASGEGSSSSKGPAAGALRNGIRRAIASNANVSMGTRNSTEQDVADGRARCSI